MPPPPPYPSPLLLPSVHLSALPHKGFLYFTPSPPHPPLPLLTKVVRVDAVPPPTHQNVPVPPPDGDPHTPRCHPLQQKPPPNSPHIGEGDKVRSVEF